MQQAIVTGAGGLLGSEVAAVLRAAGDFDVAALPHAELDVTDAPAVQAAFQSLRPALVVHCAAYTKVDDAETQQALAMAVNRDGARIVAEAAAAAQARLVHVSSDYVFDGSKNAPYVESDPPAPLSAYGWSKLEGERAVAAACPQALICRSSWLFGPAGANFVATMIKLAREPERERLTVVDDQVGTPTYARDLAKAILALVRADATGLCHVAGQPPASWWQLAVEAVRRAHNRGKLERAIEVAPTKTAEYPRTARRPPYSALACARYQTIVGRPPPDWRRGLAAYVEEIA